jgi:hypothetical protein
MKPKWMARQGDVLVIKIDDAPPGAEPAPADPRGLVLAEGESSGHFHAVFGKGHKLYNFRATSERMLTVARAGTEMRVVGGESGAGVARHEPIVFPSRGKYLVRVQRSWTSDQYSRQVSD